MIPAPILEASYDLSSLDPVANPLWHEFVSRCSDALIFHHPQWLMLLRDQYRFKTFALCLLRQGSIVAGLPLCEIKSMTGKRRWVCLPFSDRCGPLSDGPADLVQLLSRVLLRAKSANASLEIRASVSSLVPGRTATEHWLHLTEIGGKLELLQQGLHSDVRRRIKKTQAIGLTNEIRRDALAMELFYDLHLTTRRKQGVPIQPRGYFAHFQRHIIDQGLGFVSITMKGNRPLSAAVFCTFNGTITYKYGASDPTALELSPNYLMFWESIKYANQKSMRILDFGKTSIDNAGLRFFKNKWNSVESDLPYFYAPEMPSVRDPSSIASLVVKTVIQRSPPLVCRMIGELLYRRFAA